MTAPTRDGGDFDRFILRGCTEREAHVLISAGVDPAVVGSRARDAVPFVEAAHYHDLDINGRLASHGGDPDAAWQAWADEEESSEAEGESPDED